MTVVDYTLKNWVQLQITIIELIFCVCEYFAILFTIKKDKIGKEEFLFILPIT